MKPKLTDIQTISRRKCEKKGCPNKSIAIYKKKFFCIECYNRKSPYRKYRWGKLKYIRYILPPK